MNKRVVRQVINVLDRVQVGAFAQDDVRLLFTDLRQFVSSPFLREIAHFVAHPEGRDKGLSHREIDLRFWKIRRVANSSPPLPLSPLSDYFMDLWRYGIQNTSAKSAKQYFGTDRQSASALVEQAYVHAGSDWMLRGDLGEGLVSTVWRIMHGVFNAFQPKEFFTQDAIRDELKRAVRHLPVREASSFAAAIDAHATDITVCLLCALQHSDLRLHDGTTATLKWGDKVPPSLGEDTLGLFSAFRIPYPPPPDGFLNIRIHHFSSRALVSEFLDGPSDPDMLVTAVRLPSGRLKLVRHE